MMTDPIADMLTRIRNALRIRRETVDIPLSRLKVGVAEVLKREGYILSFREIDTTPARTLRIELRYGPDGEDIIRSIQRASKPGCRVYSGVEELKPVKWGQGISIVSTSRGVLSDRECRRDHVGGEVLATVW